MNISLPDNHNHKKMFNYNTPLKVIVVVRRSNFRRTPVLLHFTLFISKTP